MRHDELSGKISCSLDNNPWINILLDIFFCRQIKKQIASEDDVSIATTIATTRIKSTIYHGEATFQWFMEIATVSDYANLPKVFLLYFWLHRNSCGEDEWPDSAHQKVGEGHRQPTWWREAFAVAYWELRRMLKSFAKPTSFNLFSV